MFEETTAATQSPTQGVEELSESTRQFSLGSDAIRTDAMVLQGAGRKSA